MHGGGALPRENPPRRARRNPELRKLDRQQHVCRSTMSGMRPCRSDQLSPICDMRMPPRSLPIALAMKAPIVPSATLAPLYKNLHQAKNRCAIELVCGLKELFGSRYVLAACSATPSKPLSWHNFGRRDVLFEKRALASSNSGHRARRRVSCISAGQVHHLAVRTLPRGKNGHTHPRRRARHIIGGRLGQCARSEREENYCPRSKRVTPRCSPQRIEPTLSQSLHSPGCAHTSQHLPSATAAMPSLSRSLPTAPRVAAYTRLPARSVTCPRNARHRIHKTATSHKKLFCIEVAHLGRQKICMHASFLLCSLGAAADSFRECDTMSPDHQQYENAALGGAVQQQRASVELGRTRKGNALS